MKQLPVSKKVYADISDRLHSSLPQQSATEAMRIVDAYLQGTPADSADSMALLAFNMIRVELDRAVTRSRRARERAKARKAAGPAPKKLSPEEIISRLMSQLTPDDFEEVTGPNESPASPPLPPTRRQRRKAGRTKKQRWKPLA